MLLAYIDRLLSWAWDAISRTRLLDQGPLMDDSLIVFTTGFLVRHIPLEYRCLRDLLRFDGRQCGQACLSFESSFIPGRDFPAVVFQEFLKLWAVPSGTVRLSAMPAP